MRACLPLFILLLLPRPGHAQTENYPIGSVAPNFTVNDVSGEEHDLYSYTGAGKHVLLAFWFVSCIPCEQTAPKVAELYETYGCNSADLVVLRVNAGIDMDWQIEQFGALHGGPFQQPPAIDQEGSAVIAGTLGVFVYPTYCLIRPDNVIHDNAIWPVPDMQTFVDAFPAGSSIQPVACTSLGLPVDQQATDLHIFPSPTAGTIELDLGRIPLGDGIRMEVRDLAGRAVLERTLTARRTAVDLSRTDGGHYVVRLIDQDGRVMTRTITVAR